MIFSAERLIQGISLLLIKNGAGRDAALVTAEVLVEGDLKGYPLHGVERIFQILDGVSKSTIDLKAKSILLKSAPAMAVIDGQFGLGQPLAKQAMELAIDKAHDVGVGVVGVINSGHIGILSYFSEIASSRNCFGLVMSTSSPAVVVAGGQEKTFGTNPISYSFPTSTSQVTADFSTSAVSRSTIIKYLTENKKIPFGWAVDSNGCETDDPQEALRGGIHTIDADIKGSLISMLVSVVAGHLIGGVINPLVVGTRYMDYRPNKGDFFMALDISHFTDLARFMNCSDNLVQFINQQNVSFRMPGARSALDKKEKLKLQVEISGELVALFRAYQIDI